MDKKRVKQMKFDNSELYKLALTSLAIGFMLSFREWGGAEFNAAKGTMNLILFSLFAFLALLAHFAGEKFYGARRGLDIKYRASLPGLGIGLYITFLTSGLFFILAPGTMSAEWRKKQRVGYFRYRVYLADYSYAIMTGIIANILIASILMPFQNIPILDLFAKTNMLIAIFSLIPVPQFDGLYQFVGSFYQYAFTIGLVAGFSAIYFLSLNPLYALLFGLVLGVGGMLYIFHNKYGD